MCDVPAKVLGPYVDRYVNSSHFLSFLTFLFGGMGPNSNITIFVSVLPEMHSPGCVFHETSKSGLGSVIRSQT